MNTFKVGDAVRTSASLKSGRFRDRPGFVVTMNEGGGPHGAPEYGVVLTLTRPAWRREEGRQHEVAYDSDQVVWFAPHELTARSG